MITIVDYGLGNLGSIANMLRRIGVSALITRDLAAIASAEKLILPGVGAFDHGMENLDRLGLIEPLTRRVAAGVPVLGICLGAQLMAVSSEEGRRPGLAWLQAKNVRFDPSKSAPQLKIPHMGWCATSPARPSVLFDASTDHKFYFVHSYHFSCPDPGEILATSTYGYEFPAAIGSGMVFGVQFHPEKSHRYGMALLERFAAIRP